jgi:ubiquinone/menaquinone biosynthesis C-methylase UbiE
LLELLPAGLGYPEDRKRFWDRYQTDLHALDLAPEAGEVNPASVEAQRHQQKHFDWYGGNDKQTYSGYEQMPFWKAIDADTFADWRRQVRPGSWLLDVGCAQGRSTFNFMDLPINIVGFDISKVLIRQAIQRYRQQAYAADATFFVGDGSNFPFRSESFDYVLIYGVLHHLPDPAKTCGDIARVLKPGGMYFGSENNQTVFRSLFDLLMKINTLWYDEPGAHSVISARQLSQWFANTPVRVECGTRVFVPPHLVNWLGKSLGTWLLHGSDRVGGLLPFLRNQGGLIMIRGYRTGESAATADRPGQNKSLKTENITT